MPYNPNLCGATARREAHWVGGRGEVSADPAPVSSQVRYVLTGVLPLQVGYGLTETSPLLTLGFPSDLYSDWRSVVTGGLRSDRDEPSADAGIPL